MEVINKQNLKTLKTIPLSCISDALDCYGINGGLFGIKPVLPGMNIVGPAYTVQFESVIPGTDSPAGDYIDEVAPGSIIVISNKGITNCTVWGDILTITAKIKEIQGTVIDGSCRDISNIYSLDYPVFSKDTYMKSGKNRVRLVGKQVTLTIGECVIKPGDIIMGDENGVLSIPSSMVDPVIKKAQEIMEIENKIIESVRNKVKLSEARKIYGYNNFSLNLKKESD